MPVADRRIPIVVIHAEWPPDEDEGGTRIAGVWARSAIRLFRENNRFLVIPLLGKKANRQNIEHNLKSIKNERGLVVFYGRGCDCGESLFESQFDPGVPLSSALSCVNANLLASKIVYVIACHSAKALGLQCIQTGAICYIGYEGNVSAGPDHKTIRGFEESSNIGLRTLSQGGTCLAATNRIFGEYERWIDHWSDQDDPLRVVYLLALITSQQALAQPLGDISARLI